MSYTKQNFVSGQILKADHLNAMEDGIEANDAAVAALSEEIAKLQQSGGGSLSVDKNGDATISGSAFAVDENGNAVI